VRWDENDTLERELLDGVAGKDQVPVMHGAVDHRPAHR
jgi:hypothetical protein